MHLPAPLSAALRRKHCYLRCLRLTLYAPCNACLPPLPFARTLCALAPHLAAALLLPGYTWNCRHHVHRALPATLPLHLPAVLPPCHLPLLPATAAWDCATTAPATVLGTTGLRRYAPPACLPAAWDFATPAYLPTPHYLLPAGPPPHLLPFAAPTHCAALVYLPDHTTAACREDHCRHCTTGFWDTCLHLPAGRTDCLPATRTTCTCLQTLPFWFCPTAALLLNTCLPRLHLPAGPVSAPPACTAFPGWILPACLPAWMPPAPPPPPACLLACHCHLLLHLPACLGFLHHLPFLGPPPVFFFFSLPAGSAATHLPTCTAFLYTAPPFLLPGFLLPHRTTCLPRAAYRLPPPACRRACLPATLACALHYHCCLPAACLDRCRLPATCLLPATPACRRHLPRLPPPAAYLPPATCTRFMPQFCCLPACLLVPHLPACTHLPCLPRLPALHACPATTTAPACHCHPPRFMPPTCLAPYHPACHRVGFLPACRACRCCHGFGSTCVTRLPACLRTCLPCHHAACRLPLYPRAACLRLPACRAAGSACLPPPRLPSLPPAFLPRDHACRYTCLPACRTATGCRAALPPPTTPLGCLRLPEHLPAAAVRLRLPDVPCHACLPHCLDYCLLHTHACHLPFCYAPPDLLPSCHYFRSPACRWNMPHGWVVSCHRTYHTTAQPATACHTATAAPGPGPTRDTYLPRLPPPAVPGSILVRLPPTFYHALPPPTCHHLRFHAPPATAPHHYLPVPWFLNLPAVTPPRLHTARTPRLPATPDT